MYIFNSFLNRRKTCLLGCLCTALSLQMLLFCSFQAHAETTVLTQDIYHYHSGSSETLGGCYTQTNYHSHNGSSSGGGCYTKANTHTHTGNSSSGGGCYTVKHTERVQVGCYGSDYCDAGPCGPDTSGKVYYVGTCPICYANISVYNAPANANCPNSKYEDRTTYSLGCGMSNGQVTSYSLGCNMTNQTITGYSLGCGMDPETPVGCFSVSKESEDWSTNFDILLSLDNLSVAEADNPFSVNDIPQSEESFTINENGTYTICLNTLPGYSVDPIVLEISNIDDSAPRINSITPNTSSPSQSVTYTVDADDILPDGTPGSGLHSEPYSYDKGQTWTSSNTITVNQNGELEVWVRDNLGNIAKGCVTTSNIYIPEPPKKEISNNNSSDSNDNTNSSVDNNTNMEPVVADGAPVIDTQNAAIPNNNQKKSNKPVTNKISTTKPKASSTSKPIVKSYYDVKTNTKTPVPTKEVKEIEQPDMNAVVERDISTLPQKSDINEWTKFLRIFIITSLIFLTLLLLLFLSCRFVLISNLAHKDIYHLKGLAFIHNKTASYEISIPESIIDKCDTNKLKITFNYLFRITHKDTDINVYLPDKQSYIIKPDKDVHIDIRK